MMRILLPLFCAAVVLPLGQCSLRLFDRCEPHEGHISTVADMFRRLLDDIVESKVEKQHLLQANPDMQLCSGLREPEFRNDLEPQEWQDVEGRFAKVYSAYIEDRPEAGGPAVRVIASGLQAQFNDVGEFSCQLWYREMNQPVGVPAQWVVIYPSLAHGDMWVSHFVMCALPRGLARLPWAVSVAASHCGRPGNALLVNAPQGPRGKDTIALCMQPMYNSFNNWTMVVEMFEIYKLLGVSEINIYNLRVSAMTNKAFRSYVKQPGLPVPGYKNVPVNVHRWPFPDQLKSNVWCQRGSLNDCLYRMRPKHKYVIICDLDELLVPRARDNLLDLIYKIRSPSDGAFLFQHAYFKRDYHAELHGPKPYLITQTSVWRTDKVDPPGKIRCKSMYEADRAVSLDLHFAYTLVPGATENIVEPDDGMLHHYRSYPMETFQRYPERYHYIEDYFMEKYKENLTLAYEARVKAIQETP